MLEVLILGALMGILGQGARAVIGLKGMADNAKALNLSPNDLFEAARLVTSFLIGFLVGLAAAVVYIKSYGAAEPGWQALIGFAAAGYTGTDFLEGFISQYLPSGTVGSPVQKFAAAQPLKAVPIQAVIEQRSEPKVQTPPPTFSQAEAQKFVFDAFGGLGITGVKVTDPLAKYDLNNDIALQGFALQINNQLPKKFGISDKIAWGWNGKKVSDVVTSVEYVQPVAVG